MTTIPYKQKLTRILGISGWSRDKLSDLLEVSNNSFSAWIRGDSTPHTSHAGKIDEVYDALVVPLLCEIEIAADAVEKRLLEERIARLPEDNTCSVK
jgi:transcriptional regulator with XRE-family HTH domain